MKNKKKYTPLEIEILYWKKFDDVLRESPGFDFDGEDWEDDMPWWGV